MTRTAIAHPLAGTVSLRVEGGNYRCASLIVSLGDGYYLLVWDDSYDVWDRRDLLDFLNDCDLVDGISSVRLSPLT